MPIATNEAGDSVYLDNDGQWKPAPVAEHPQTKQRLVFDGKDWTPLGPKTTTGEAVGHGIMQGASFGFRDEGQGLIEAGGGGGGKDTDALTNLGYLARGAYRKLTGDPEAEARYKAATERERAYTKQIEQEHPGAYIGGQVAGALAMPVGFAARAPTWGARAIAAAKTGAVTGGLTGFGEGEGLGGSVKGALIGAPVGGATGFAAAPIVEGLARGVGATVSYPVSVARGLFTPGDASERAIGRALQQAAHSDPTGVNRLTTAQFVGGQAPADAVIGDVLGEPGRKLARSAANISPEAKETMNQALNARGQAQGARAISWLDNQFAFPNAHAQQQALDATKRTANNAAYKAAERQGMAGIQLSLSLMESDTVLSAMQTAAKKFKDEQIKSGSHYAAMNPRVQFDQTGALTFTRKPDGTPLYPDLRFWDLTRRELSTAERMALRQGNDSEARRIGFFANKMNEELDQHVPAYQVARRTAAGFFDAEDALKAGQNFATQRYANDEARAAIAQMNTTERALFRDGFISRTKDVLGATRDVRDITKIIGASQESRDKLAIALGPQRAREFQAVLRGEEIMQKLKEAVQGNSSTVMQLLGAGAAGAAGGGYLGFDPTTSGITSALAGGLKKGADANMARHITRLMMSQDPAVLQAGIRQLARNARNLEIMQRVSNAVTRAGAQQGAERISPGQQGIIPGRQAGGPVEEDRPYVVGERGPEVIVPDRDGTVVNNDEVRRYLRATTQDYPKFGPGGIPVNPEAFTAAVGGWPESTNVEDRRPERAAAEVAAASEAAAAKVRRRYPTREPDPGALALSQGAVSWDKFLPSEERLKIASDKVARGEPLTYVDQREIALAGLGVVGSPVRAAQGAGTVLGAGAVRSARPAAKAVEAVAPKAPEVPMLLGNPELRGSMSTTDNVPFTYRGKGPAEWTPQEYEEVGKHFGVDRLGPETPPTAFKYGDGKTFNIPGGLEGQFTYYDLLRMKADGIDPSRIPRDVHTQLQQKLMRSMDVPQPASPERTWSGLMFGMTSPNNPLFPNQLTQSVLRMREPGLRQQLAEAIPWKVGEKVSQADRLAASGNIANMLGINAASKGGLGVRGSTDYTRIAELAQMWEKHPQWFSKTDAETWPKYVERLSSQVSGLSMKTGSFGGVWQDPAHAGVSAIDRHMVNEFERTGNLFKSPAEKEAFEKRAIERWNNANEGRPIDSYDQLPEGFLTKMKLEYVGNEQQVKLRTVKGDISPNVPPHLANVQWPSEPSHVKVMGDAYQRALDWNQTLANQHGLNLFPSQWLEWDRIRRRFEPHENMFPGLERMPAMSRDQLRQVSAEHTASGHKTYGKTEGEEGQMNLQPTRPRPNPGNFAYFTMPPAGTLPRSLMDLFYRQDQ